MLDEIIRVFGSHSLNSYLCFIEGYNVFFFYNFRKRLRNYISVIYSQRTKQNEIANTFNFKNLLITVTICHAFVLNKMRPITTRKITKYSCVDEDTFIPRQSRNRFITNTLNFVTFRFCAITTMGQLKKVIYRNCRLSNIFYGIVNTR